MKKINIKFYVLSDIICDFEVKAFVKKNLQSADVTLYGKEHILT
jgi:hypothetical protein